MNRFLDELAQIGKTDDFLSERPGHPFDRQCRHIRTREIGERIFEIGGADAMEWAVKKYPNAAEKILPHIWNPAGSGSVISDRQLLIQ